MRLTTTARQRFAAGFATLLGLGGAPVAQGQIPGARVTFSGSVQDARTGEKLLGAAVYVAGGQVGTSTNAAGFYSLTLPAQDSVRLTVSFLGYERATVVLAGRHATTHAFTLAARNELGEVRVVAPRTPPWSAGSR